MTEHEHSKFTDSAGVAWEGRSFEQNSYQGDSGLADEKLIASIVSFQNNESGPENVLKAIGSARLLIPLVANLTEAGEGVDGLKIDKSADLSIVTVLTPDNQKALPVFSSVATMALWNPQARPVPNDGRRVALAAASEGNTRLVLDPMSPTEFVVRRPGIAAIAQGLDWISPENNSEVVELINDSLNKSVFVESFTLVNGDPTSRLLGQELVVILYLAAGVSPLDIQGFETEFFGAISNSERFVELVDSVGVKYLPAS